MKKLLLLLLLWPTLALAQPVTPQQTGITGPVLSWPSSTGNFSGTLTKNALATTSTDGLTIQNATAATAAVPVQTSPRLRFRSNVWNTTATAANNTDDWWMESLPVSGTTPSGTLRFVSSLNGTAATIPVYFTTAGTIYVIEDLIAGVSRYLSISSQVNFQGVATGKVNLTNWAVTAGIGLNVTTDSVVLFQNRTHNGAGGIGFKTLAVSGTDPTIASGGCTSPAVTSANGTASFKLTIGTSCTGVTTITLTMPAATNYWMCDATDITTNATFRPEQSAAASATSVVITNYARTTGLAIDFVAGEVLLVKCLGG